MSDCTGRGWPSAAEQDEQDGEVSGRAERSTHESGEAVAAWQDAPASLQQLVPHHLQLVVECGGAQQGEGRDLIVTS